MWLIWSAPILSVNLTIFALFEVKISFGRYIDQISLYSPENLAENYLFLCFWLLTFEIVVAKYPFQLWKKHPSKMDVLKLFVYCCVTFFKELSLIISICSSSLIHIYFLIRIWKISASHQNTEKRNISYHFPDMSQFSLAMLKEKRDRLWNCYHSIFAKGFYLLNSFPSVNFAYTLNLVRLNTEAHLFAKIEDQKTIYISINWMAVYLLNKSKNAHHANNLISLENFKYLWQHENFHFHQIKNHYSVTLVGRVLWLAVNSSINSFNGKWFEGKRIKSLIDLREYCHRKKLTCLKIDLI